MKKTSENLTIYAELSKKQFNLLVNGDVEIEIPYGTSMRHRKGSRQLWFECESQEIVEELTDGLDASRINWSFD